MSSSSGSLTKSKELTDKDFEGKSSPKSHSPRRKANWPISLQTREKQKVEGRTINVSEQGLLILIPLNLLKGDTVFVEIHSIYKGKKRFLQAICEVRYNSVGVEGFQTDVKINSATGLTSDFLEEYSSEALS